MFKSIVAILTNSSNTLRITDLKMETFAAAVASDGLVDDLDNDVPNRQTTASDRQAIFCTCKSTMVDGRVKKGIFSELAKQLKFKPGTISTQWHSMESKLKRLLNNHPGEDEAAVVARNHHILFEPLHARRKKGKYKYNRDDLTASVAALSH